MLRVNTPFVGQRDVRDPPPTPRKSQRDNAGPMEDLARRVARMQIDLHCARQLDFGHLMDRS